MTQPPYPIIHFPKRNAGRRRSGHLPASAGIVGASDRGLGRLGCGAGAGEGDEVLGELRAVAALAEEHPEELHRVLRRAGERPLALGPCAAVGLERPEALEDEVAALELAVLEVVEIEEDVLVAEDVVADDGHGTGNEESGGRTTAAARRQSRHIRTRGGAGFRKIRRSCVRRAAVSSGPVAAASGSHPQFTAAAFGRGARRPNLRPMPSPSPAPAADPTAASNEPTGLPVPPPAIGATTALAVGAAPPNAPLPESAGGLSRARATLATALAVTIWGGSFLMSKAALAELSAPEVVLWRFVLSLPALLLLALRLRPRRADLPGIVGAGVLGVPVLFLLQVEGVARTTATRAALVIGLLPPLAALGGVLVLGERATRRLVAALALSTFGLGLVVGWPGGGGSVSGDLLVAASAVVSVAYVLATARLVQRYDPAGLAAWTQAAGTLVLVAVVLAWQGPPRLPTHAATWAALAGLSLGCTVAANALWNVGLKTLGAARAGVFVNLEPLLGATLGVALLGEPLGTGALVGGACIVAATLLARR